MLMVGAYGGQDMNPRFPLDCVARCLQNSLKMG